MHTSATSIVNAILFENFDLSTDEVMTLAKQRGAVSKDDRSLRQLVHNQRSIVRKKREQAKPPKSAPAPAAKQTTEATTTATAPVAPMTQSKESPVSKPKPETPATNGNGSPKSVLHTTIEIASLMSRVGGGDRLREAAALLRSVGDDLGTYIDTIEELSGEPEPEEVPAPKVA